MANQSKSTPIKKERDRTKKLKALFIENYFQKTGNIAQLCKELNMNRGTYYQWMEKDEKFRRVIEAEQEGLIDFVESKLFNLINDKNVAAVIFFLKTKAKNRGYIEKTELEHSGSIRATLSMTDLKDSIKDFDENGSSK